MSDERTGPWLALRDGGSGNMLVEVAETWHIGTDGKPDFHEVRKMSDEKPTILYTWIDADGVEHYTPATIAARLRGMASDPRNAADMRLLVAAAKFIEEQAP